MVNFIDGEGGFRSIRESNGVELASGIWVEKTPVRSVPRNDIARGVTESITITTPSSLRFARPYGY